MALKRTLPIDAIGTGVNLLVSKSKLFSDIDLSFTAKPGTPAQIENDEFTGYRGDIYKKNEAAAVKQALQNLILTNHFEKPFEPYFGANLRALLFENMEDYDEQEIERRIRESVRVWEPRVTLEKVDIFLAEDVNATSRKITDSTARFEYDHRADRNTVSVSIVFSIKNIAEQLTLNVDLTRLR